MTSVTFQERADVKVRKIRTPGPPLTRDAVLQFVSDFIGINGYSPSIREIGNGVGLASTSSVKYHLDALKDAGRIFQEEGVNRSIRLIESPMGQCCPMCGRGA